MGAPLREYQKIFEKTNLGIHRIKFHTVTLKIVVTPFSHMPNNTPIYPWIIRYPIYPSVIRHSNIRQLMPSYVACFLAFWLPFVFLEDFVDFVIFCLSKQTKLAKLIHPTYVVFSVSVYYNFKEFLKNLKI